MIISTLVGLEALRMMFRKKRSLQCTHTQVYHHQTSEEKCIKKEQEENREK